ncbi:Hypothetical protein D9617_25g060980 [Elsinoe fawcettii]|nr:Hypothetical protein D9617_25g060980 [Elsinoe fawcettii]
MASPRDTTFVTGVLDDPYLVEQILTMLGMADLLRCMSVSTTFRSVILNSTKIKQKLFLVPIIEGPQVYTDAADGSAACHQCSAAILAPEEIRDSEQREAHITHPLLFQAPEYGRRARVIVGAESRLLEMVEDLGNHASWQDMLLTQPPIASVWYIWVSRHNTEEYQEVIRADTEDGLTWGCVIREIRDIMDNEAIGIVPEAAGTFGQAQHETCDVIGHECLHKVAWPCDLIFEDDVVLIDAHPDANEGNICDCGRQVRSMVMEL